MRRWSKLSCSNSAWVLQYWISWAKPMTLDKARSQKCKKLKSWSRGAQVSEVPAVLFPSLGRIRVLCPGLEFEAVSELKRSLRRCVPGSSYSRGRRGVFDFCSVALQHTLAGLLMGHPSLPLPRRQVNVAIADTVQKVEIMRATRLNQAFSRFSHTVTSVPRHWALPQARTRRHGRRRANPTFQDTFQSFMASSIGLAMSWRNLLIISILVE